MLPLVQGGESQNAKKQVSAASESWDERIIRASIEAAQSEEREIDDRTARYIVLQPHGGQGTALTVWLRVVLLMKSVLVLS
ncbi:MAG: hypothetical protein ACRDTT_12180 [Pseudonocardiaceae bacterium]